MSSARYHPERVLQPLQARRPQGLGPVRAGRLGQALDEIAARLKPVAARRPAGHPALQLCGHDGSGAGRDRWRRASSTGSVPRCWTARSARSAGSEALMYTLGGKVGMRVEFFAESRLILIWGSNSIAQQPAFLAPCAAGQARRREADLHRPAPDRHRRQVRRAHRAAARHRRGAGAGADARADRARLARPRLPRAAHARLGSTCANARCSGRPSARRLSAASMRADRLARARLRHHSSRPRSA